MTASPAPFFIPEKEKLARNDRHNQRRKAVDKNTLSFIRNGLYQNPGNYELYLLLGLRYADSNPDLAYLAYENAEFYCEMLPGKEKELEEIRLLMQKLRNEIKVRVVPCSIIILSYNTLSYTKRCIESIRRTVKKESCEIIVIDNASEDGSREWLMEQPDIRVFMNETNVGFPAGCNQGIREAMPGNDIFLLNSDTVLFPNSLFYLRMGLYGEPKVGVAGSISNAVGNDQQIDDVPQKPEDLDSFVRDINLPMENPWEIRTFLSGFAQLIKREVIDEIGGLDERFTPGYFEDNDFGLRVLMAGYRNICCWNSFIFHYGNKSFGNEGTNQYVQEGMAKFRDKWGIQTGQSTSVRMEMIDFMDDDRERSIRVLEIGCGCGETLMRIKYLFPNAEVHGVESVPEIAELGAKKTDIICGNVETMTIPFEKNYFDYIIAADVLETMVLPEKVLGKLKDYLKPEGKMLVSLSNLMNANVIYELLHGYFTYQDSGILNQSHLRFFTYHEIPGLFARGGFSVVRIKPKAAYGELTSDHQEFFDQLLAIEGVADRAFFDSYQFLVAAKKA